MKRNVFISALMLSFLAMGTAAFGRGESCSFPIELGKDFKAQIDKPGTYWYVANTFDLPLSVYFSPINESDPAPEIEMDFSCTSGVYTDSIICSLFCANEGSGVSLDMPHKPKLNKTTQEGKLMYYLSMGQAYRDLLLKAGIDYNVEVYIKVVYSGKGEMAMAPDDMFANCMDGYKFMHLGDTVHVQPKDKERHVIVPFVQWQSDSIRFVWEGEGNVTIAVGSTCEFDPTKVTEESVVMRKTASEKDTVKVTSEKLTYYVRFEENAGGMFYAKFYSEHAGILKIERVPMAPPAGDAQLLKYDKKVSIAANDTFSLYAIPMSWDTATIFTTPTDYTFCMYMDLSPEFTPATAVDSFRFDKTADGHALTLKTEQMKALCAKALDNYLYVRFRCAAKTSVTPDIWDVPDCLLEWSRLEMNGQITVEKKTYGTVFYGVYYNAIKDGDLTFKWSGKSYNCTVTFGDTCQFSAGNASAPHVIFNKNIAKNGGSLTITQETIASWAEHVDPDGYVYVRFNTEEKNTMTISSTAPEETDPAFVPVSEILLEPTRTVLDDLNPTASIKATIMPANATNPSLTWEITKGEDLVKWNQATYSVTRRDEATSGEVTVTATAMDGSGITSSVMFSVQKTTTDVTTIPSETDYSRIVMREGTMYIELNRAGQVMRYDMTGRRVE